ncbi:MAG: OmpA family protein [Marinifilaceae bacterium]|jgi:chemotaxis protein MotB|nr:OmpA family protein [Marinifilaceae bacterium]
MKIRISIIILLCSFLYSCVSTKQYEEAKALADDASLQLESEKENNRLLTEENNELQANLENTNRKYESLLQDTVELSNQIIKLKEKISDLEQNNKDLFEQLKKTKLGSQSESKSLLNMISKTQTALKKREDMLQDLEAELAQKRKKINAMMDDLNARDKKLRDLEAELARNSKKLNSLKTKISNALTNFKGKGLSVYTKDGKVYVSMENKLLFKSGSFTINPQGAKAITDLSKVLAVNKEFSIMIEGHTDNVPYKSASLIKDNWDLSVKRATSVVRIILKNKKIEAKRLIVAGRSKYLPIASNKTPEGRGKNRRTEIILTPNIENIMKLIK